MASVGKTKEEVLFDLRRSIKDMEQGALSGRSAGGGEPSERTFHLAGQRSDSSHDAARGLHQGDNTQSNDASLIQEPLDADKNRSSKQAHQKILQILGYRDRTRHELREKLLKAGFDEDVIDCAIEHAACLGLVDDERFCSNYIEQMFRSGKGRKAVLLELKRKGIEEHAIHRFLENSSYACEDEEGRALSFLEKHQPRGKNLRDSAFRKLVAKGYSVNASSKAAARYCSLHSQQE